MQRRPLRWVRRHARSPAVLCGALLSALWCVARWLSAPAAAGVDPVPGLMSRVFGPAAADRVSVTYTGAAAPEYQLTASGGRLQITADGPLSAASAVHRWCLAQGGCTTSWGVAERRMPLNFGEVIQPVQRRAVPLVYYLNYCTHSYTMAWWGWERWERELDWMALHGVTSPLISIHREAVMLQVFTRLGMSEKAVLGFFTGPGFLAWHRMGNLKGFGGPLPRGYIDHSTQLAHRVLRRARELGMRPVLPGLAGQVPEELRQLRPDGEYSRLPRWSGFPAEYSGLSFVEPSSDLYREIGSMFIRIQAEMFGTDHFYAVDQFNENDPRSNRPEYLALCGEAQIKALQEADSRAVWVVQGWLFVFHQQFWQPEQIQAYLSKVPRSGLLVLDLISEATPAYETTRQYHDSPWVWNLLHNFGGQNGLRGNLPTLMSRPYKALHDKGSTMAGIGLTMEAINQNPIVYELVLDHAWNPAPRDLTQWLEGWVAARYGFVLPLASPAEQATLRSLQQAWQTLANSVYSVFDPAQGNGLWGTTKSVIEKRPSFNREAVLHDGFQSSKLHYNNCDLHRAWLALLGAASDLRPGSALELDLIDLSRQVLANLAAGIYLKFIRHLEHGHPDTGRASREFLELLDDLDALLSRTDHFSFERWLQDALALANGKEERALYAFNARNLVTRWGPNGEISDYSARLWSGLIRSYYKRRWEIAMRLGMQSRSESADGGSVDEMSGESAVKVSDQVFADQLGSFEAEWQQLGEAMDPVAHTWAQGSVARHLTRVRDKYAHNSALLCSTID